MFNIVHWPSHVASGCSARLPPGILYRGLLLPLCTSPPQGGTPTLPVYDYPPVLLPCQDVITPHTQGGYFYPARAGLPPGTSTLPRVRLPPIHRGVLLPCQDRITPWYFHPVSVWLLYQYLWVFLRSSREGPSSFPGKVLPSLTVFVDIGRVISFLVLKAKKLKNQYCKRSRVNYCGSEEKLTKWRKQISVKI